MTRISRGHVWNYGGNVLQAGDTVAVTYVTVIGYDHDFAVYAGDPAHSVEDIAHYGDKASEPVGRAVAPYCSHLTYRE